MKIVQVKISELKFAEYNPRKAGEKDIQDLKNSLKEFGFVDPIVVNSAPNRKNVIIGGHFRVRVVKDMGIREVPVVYVSIPDENKERELNLRLNKNLGQWDYDLLANFDEETLKRIGWIEGELCKIFNLDECKEDGLDEMKKISKLKILNLYSSIGGNRRLWGDLDITAVENNKGIAEAYRKLYPKDKVIVGDAHKYLEEHFNEYDFIWASPPCPTHSRLRKAGKGKPKYPDMRLYEEIIFLKGYFKGKWVVENVISWYEPLLEPQKRGRHYFWANFEIIEIGYPWEPAAGPMNKWNKIDFKAQASRFCFDEKDIPNVKGYSRATILRDLIHPKEGEYILKCAYGKTKIEGS